MVADDNLDRRVWILKAEIVSEYNPAKRRGRNVKSVETTTSWGDDRGGYFVGDSVWELDGLGS